MNAHTDETDQVWDRIKQSLAELKQLSYENFFVKKADAVWGVILPRGYHSLQEVITHLEEAEAAGQITEDDARELLAADLFWSGQIRRSPIKVTLVVKVSYVANQHTLDWVSKAADVLCKLNLYAVPVVVARDWNAAVRAAALAQHVLIVDDCTVNMDSWQALLQSRRAPSDVGLIKI